MSLITKYDKTSVFSEIKPVLEQLKLICVKNNIPMAVSIALKNDEDGTVYKNEAFMPVSAGIHLKDDYISQILLAVNGGKFVPPAAYKDIEKAYAVEADPDNDNEFDIGTNDELADALLNYVVDEELPVQEKKSSAVVKKQKPVKEKKGEKATAKVTVDSDGVAKKHKQTKKEGK